MAGPASPVPNRGTARGPRECRQSHFRIGRLMHTW
jgi:hypothetical protein